MKYQLLLLWTLTALVSCEPAEIQVKELSDGIELTCKTGIITPPGVSSNKGSKLEYIDENTGEYTCNMTDSKIYVKFRTCDNCVELDAASIAGIVVGDVVATVAVGVAVYLIASKSRASQNTSTKKRSDRQPLVINEMRNTSANDNYQPLRPRQVQVRDEYDVLRK